MGTSLLYSTTKESFALGKKPLIIVGSLCLPLQAIKVLKSTHNISRFIFITNNHSTILGQKYNII